MKRENMPRVRDGAIRTIADVILERLPRYGNGPVIRYDDGSRYVNVPLETYLDGIGRMSRFLEKAGAGRQAVVATFCKNRPEWDATAFAAMLTGNILFPLDIKMNREELVRLFSSCPPDYILVSRPQLERIRALVRELKLSTRLLVADWFRTHEDGAEGGPGPAGPDVLPLTSLPVFAKGDGLPSPPPRLDDPDTVLAHYATSGTTSLPKVVRLTHGNILFQLNRALDMIHLRKNEDVLSLGPYTHIATLLEFLVSKSRAFTVTYFTREADADKTLEDEIKKLKRQGVRIRCLMAVPKFWYFMLKEILEEMNAKPVYRNLYRHLRAIETSDHFYDIGTLDKAKLMAARTLLRNKLGGYFAFGFSSSSKIEPGVVDIFAKLGIAIVDVYGATEAAGVIAKNELNRTRRGFCGRLLDGFDYRLAHVREVDGLPHPVGELFIRGPGIARGYLGPDASLPVGEDGFYATGDVAYVDGDRWVYLVGRKKELIEWPDGRFTDPMQVSNLLVRSIWVKDGLAVREGESPNMSVFLYPDAKRIENSVFYRESLKKGLGKNEILRMLLEEAVDYAQSLLGDFPRLSKERIYILGRSLERTPTHKIKFVSEIAKLDRSVYV
jgi:long-subunit acyl-CoA synthetase (AMP-forming)